MSKRCGAALFLLNLIATESRRLSPALSSLGFSAHPPTTPSHRSEQSLLTNLHHSKLSPSFVRRAPGKYLATPIDILFGPVTLPVHLLHRYKPAFRTGTPCEHSPKTFIAFTLFVPSSTFARHCIIFSLSNQTLSIDTHRTVAKD